jgi:alkylation response protein AidB-like acyl-CoA dehydrogenase
MALDLFELRYSDYSLSDDELAVRDAFREFFTEQCPASRVRAAEPLGYDAKLWRQVAELGATAMGLPASAGGDAAGLLLLAVVAEEAGAALAPVPFAEHTAASRAVAGLAGGQSANADVARMLAAVSERPLSLVPEPVTGAAWALVPAGAVSRDVLALDGDDLVLLRAQEPPPLARNQGSTPLARWPVRDGVTRTVLAEGPGAASAHATACAEWRLLTAAALVGLTERALGVAVEFTKTRETMGVPIGSLQGVAFPLADVEIGVSGARNLVRKAAWMADNEPGEHPGLIPAAFAYAAAAATHGATTAAHMQGGLGFTVEADASLYFLRAKGWSVLGGDPARQAMAVGDALIARALSTPPSRRDQ